ncbi:hypothetical protein V5O48_014952, partial [Marasmius crinis-equi]
ASAPQRAQTPSSPPPREVQGELSHPPASPPPENTQAAPDRPDVSPLPAWKTLTPIRPSSASHTRDSSPTADGTASPPDHIASPVPDRSDLRPTTPSPLPNCSPSPLPDSDCRTSKRKAVSSQQQQWPRPTKRGKRAGEEISEPSSGRKRKAEDQPHPNENESKKCRIDGASSGSTAVESHQAERADFPVLPTGSSKKASSYATQAMVLFQRHEVQVLKGWKSAVWDWYELEKQGDFGGKDCPKLSTKGRPDYAMPARFLRPGGCGGEITRASKVALKQSEL